MIIFFKNSVLCILIRIRSDPDLFGPGGSGSDLFDRQEMLYKFCKFFLKNGPVSPCLIAYTFPQKIYKMLKSLTLKICRLFCRTGLKGRIRICIRIRTTSFRIHNTAKNMFFYIMLYFPGYFPKFDIEISLWKNAIQSKHTGLALH